MIKCERGRTNPLKMQRKTATNTLCYGECLCLLHYKHLYSWGRITQTSDIPSRIQKASQWNKCSTYLQHWCLNKMRSMDDWDDYSWKYLSMFGEQVISLQRTKVYVFSDSVLCLGKMHENFQSNTASEDRLAWFKSSPEFRNLDRTDGEPIEFEWKYFPRIQYVAAQSRSQKFIVEIRWDTREFHRKDYLHVDVQRHIIWIKWQWKRMRVKCSIRFSICKEIWNRTMVISWSWFREKWYSISADSPQGEWDRIAEKMMLEFGESRHPVFRATSPLSRGSVQKQRRWKTVDTLLCRFGYDLNCF